MSKFTLSENADYQYLDMKPDYIRSRQNNSFSYYTIKNRLPLILQNIKKENPLFVSDVLNEFASGLFEERISKIHDNENSTLFDQSVCQFEGETIFDAPFFVSEMYFYNRIMSILRKNGIHNDPFFAAKKKALENSNKFLEKLTQKLYVDGGSSLKRIDINSALASSLWGNLADLSLFSDNQKFDVQIENADQILINDSEIFINKMLSQQCVIHIFADNVGYELLSDLFLISILLMHTNHTIRVHVKPIPMFVSDVTQSDWDFTLSYMEKSKYHEVKKWHQFIENAIKSERLLTETHSFWSSCYHFSDEWFKQIGIAENDFVISKGDLNYRRFFEDRTWSPTTDVPSSISISKNSGVLIRTMKSEIVTGLDPKIIEALETQEKNWMTSGKFGLIQCFNY